MASDVHPVDVGMEAIADRVAVASAQCIDPVEHELEVGPRLVAVHSSSFGGRAAGPDVNVLRRRTCTTTQPRRDRAQPHWRPALEE
jgi:hypothetical protein